MCARKGDRKCPELLEAKEAAYREWCRAETLSEVRAAWGRYGGKVTLHRRGTDWFVLLALSRWGRIGTEELEAGPEEVLR